MIALLAVEDVVFLVSLSAIAVGCRVALRRADDAQCPADRSAIGTRTGDRARSW
jgi:hypothetical protein